MFGIGFFKGLPTQYVMRYVSGRVTRQGPGLAFFYTALNTQIVAVPTSSKDESFVFNELTGNFQAVTVQGQFTYRIADPTRAASQLNFTLDGRGPDYVSNDPELLARRITNVIQMETRAALVRRSLEESLSGAEAIANEVFARVREGMTLPALGVELVSLYIVAIKPTPEVGRALEATYRESLLRRQDEAIYARRAAAVEEERKIKENELQTDVTLEQQREGLIALQGSNALQQAELQGKALEMEAQSRARDLEMQMAVFRTMQPAALLALAMQEMGKNADKIGNLTITSEILASVLNALPGAGS